jgi:hypothetical protein
VRSATLRLQENGDPGTGTLRVHRGSHNNWTETTLSSVSAPAENGQVGLFTGNVTSAQVVNIDVTPLVTGNGTYSVILKKDSGGNDIWFGSEESGRKPQLIVETSSGATIGQTLSVDGDSDSEVAGPSYFAEGFVALSIHNDSGTANDAGRGSQLINELEPHAHSPLARIRVTRVGPAELELGWDVPHEGEYHIQVCPALSGGAWTTLLSTARSTGSLNIPVVDGVTNAFFRVIQAPE